MIQDKHSTNNAPTTQMFREAMQADEVVAQQLERNAQPIEDAVRRLKAISPKAIVTCARGSSDHAATYAKYLFETYLGLLTASAAPSVGSLYASKQQLEGMIYFAISQSGKSPDLLAHAQGAKDAGATLIACVNQADSPLAELADIVIPVHAGKETSVAATKSYIGTLTALLQFAALWTQNSALLQTLPLLARQLKAAQQLDWQPAVDMLKDKTNLFVIGRGLGLGIAQEAALKLKETCGLHAEAFSAAEVRHGPMTLVGPGFPVLLLAQEDQTLSGMDALAEEFMQRGANLLMASQGPELPWRLPVVQGAHPAAAPILTIQSFYLMANKLALSRGLDPDRPVHLKKVTETL